MHVISYKAIREYKAAHADAESGLDNWYRAALKGDYKNFVQVRKEFGSADWVSPYVVFNIAGNKYRLIAEINFRSQTLFIRHILTHDEYRAGR